VFIKANLFLQDVVREINNLTVDYVFIAGDFTFEPKTENLEKLFSAAKRYRKNQFTRFWVITM
jgi:hypothetical protein